MESGALLLKKDFFSDEEMKAVVQSAQSFAQKKEKVHEAGEYNTLNWFQVRLDLNSSPWLIKVFNTLGIKDAELVSFYYLEPSAILHAHRDLTGASLNNRLRFHIPVITNPGVDFRVSGKKIIMLPGELWCLDTSYLHSVKNEGNTSRVHIVIECQVTDNILRLLPKRSMRDHMHSAFFACVLGAKLLQSIFVNLFFNPKRLKAQFSMIRNFVNWRVLKRSKPS